jgi:CHAT domain-containing protein/tetratricopeptide (TPR) repeat protein
LAVAGAALLPAGRAVAQASGPTDPKQAAARQAMADAAALRAEGSAESNRRAVERLEEAAALWRELGDAANEAEALDALSTVLFRTQIERVVPVLDRYLFLARTLGDAKREARVLSRLGSVYSRQGDVQQAQVYIEAALSAARALGDKDLEARAMGNLTHTYWRTGQHAKAFEVYGEALAIWRELGNRAEIARSLHNIGLFHTEMGDVQPALDLLREALAIRRELNDRLGLADTMLNLGDVYVIAGDRERALDLFQQALVLARETGERGTEARALESVGASLHAQGQLAEALRHYDTALVLLNQSGMRSSIAVVHTARGHIHRALGHAAEARSSFERALEVSLEIGDPTFEGRARRGIALVHADAAQPPEARQSFEEALRLLRSAGSRPDEAATLYDLARFERGAGDLEAARARVQEAISVIEDVRSTVVSRDLRASYAASHREYYELQIDILMRLHARQPAAGFDALAVGASERARARGLLDALAEARQGIREGLAPGLRDAERDLQRRLSAAEARRGDWLAEKGRGERPLAIERELDGLVAEYRDLQERIRVASPRYAALMQPVSLTLPEIQAEVIDDESLLLEYALGEERSYVWAITRGSVQSHELPARRVVEDAARRAHALLMESHRRGRRGQADLALAELSRIVLGPVAGLLGHRRLLVVADGALHYVPFAALPPPSVGAEAPPLVVVHEVAQLPSASSLAALRRDVARRARAAKAVAVLSDPVFRADDPRVRRAAAEVSAPAPPVVETDVTRAAAEAGLAALERLPFSRREADAIVAVAPPGDSLEALDFAASRATAMSPALADYRVVHFATHGLVNNRHPELSGIALSMVDEAGRPQDGFLRLTDLYSLKLGADLVVLSACQTALGKEVRGEGLVGLTRGFFYAGAPRVIASLWSVRDEATATLMARFYRALLGDGQSPAAALRTAQIALRKDPRWSAPYYWAGFVLQGEWRE